MKEKILAMLISKDVEMVDLGVRMLLNNIPLNECEELIKSLKKIPRIKMGDSEARVYHSKGSCIIRFPGFYWFQNESEMYKTSFPLLNHIDV